MQADCWAGWCCSGCLLAAAEQALGWVCSLPALQLCGLSSALRFHSSTQVNAEGIPFLEKDEEDVEDSKVPLKVRTLFCPNADGL